MNNNNQNVSSVLEVLSMNTKYPNDQYSLPQALLKLPKEEQQDIAGFISEIVQKEDEAYAKLFESLAMMMKYVPNFILHQIIPRYVEPAIAAKITCNLNTKQIVGVASGLSVDYIANTAIHMEDEVAAAVLEGLKRKLASQVIEYTIKNHPIDALDILIHAHERFHKEAKEHFHGIDVDPESLTPERQQVYRSVSGQ